MPETPEQLHIRVANKLRMPPLAEWETFPFEGEMRLRALRPPVNQEVTRTGAGGLDCGACTAPDGAFIWTTARWRLLPLKPSGLPVVLILQPRAHFAEPGDLPDELAAEMGVMLARVEAAVRAIEGVGRVHVCRWGDGSEHLHWWFLARPARLPQLLGSFAAIWDDVLPPTPEPIWQQNLEVIRGQLLAGSG